MAFEIAPGLVVPDDEIAIEYIRSPGPGGQNVNKVATAVQLRFDIRGSSSLPGEVRERLIRLAGKRVTAEGVLIIDASRFRTRERNRADARERLARWIRKAAEAPRPRKKTRPSAQSDVRRLEEKRRRGETKKARRGVPEREP